MVINLYKIKKIVHWTLAVLIVLHIISGYGITQYRLIETATLGLLTKARSFKLHSALSIPVIIFILLHVYLALKGRYFKKKDDDKIIEDTGKEK